VIAGYAIPVLCTAGGRTDLVLAGTGKLRGYDPDTGKERWTCNTLLRTIMTSPVVKDGVIYVAVQSYGDAGRTIKHALLEWLDTNQDGKLSRAEVPKEFWDRFDAADKNKDGFLSGDELDTAFQHPSNMAGGGKIIQAVKGGGTGDVTKTHLLWNLTNKAPSDLVSPLVSGNRVFVVKAGGLSSCFDAATGKTLWEKERLRNFGDYYASPLAADGKVYLGTRSGSFYIFAATREKKLLNLIELGDPVSSTTVAANGVLYVAAMSRLYAVHKAGK